MKSTITGFCLSVMGVLCIFVTSAFLLRMKNEMIFKAAVDESLKETLEKSCVMTEKMPDPLRYFEALLDERLDEKYQIKIIYFDIELILPLLKYSSHNYTLESLRLL